MLVNRGPPLGDDSSNSNDDDMGEEMTSTARRYSEESWCSDAMKSATTYEEDEKLAEERLMSLYPRAEFRRLPRLWNKNDKYHFLDISHNSLRVSYKGNGKQQQKDAASTRADYPIPPQCGVYYFEITIVRGLKGCMGVGVCGKSVNLNRLPGWDRDSYGYHGDDGNFFSSSGNGVSYGPKFTSGDVIGCGVNLVNKTIFFTKNGVHLGIASRELTRIDDLYPTIGLQTTGEVVDANFGQRPFRFDIRPEMEAARAKVANEILSIQLPPEKTDWMNKLVSSWMACEGYSKSMASFCNAAKLVPEEGEQSIETRKEVIALVLSRRSAEAIARMEDAYPDIFVLNKNIALVLKCQQFVEMAAEIARVDALSKPAPVSSSNGQSLPSSSAVTPRTTHSYPSNPHKRSYGKYVDSHSEDIEAPPARRTPPSGAIDVNIHSDMQVDEDEPCCSSKAAQPDRNGQAMTDIKNGSGPGHVDGGSVDDGVMMAGDGSTTIVEEEFTEDDEDIEVENGVKRAEEEARIKLEYQKYNDIIEFGRSIYNLSLQIPNLSGTTKALLNDALATICILEYSQFETHQLLSEEHLKDLAKQTAAAILEFGGRSSMSQLSRYIHLWIKMQTELTNAMVPHCAFTDLSQLVFGNSNMMANSVGGSTSTTQDDSTMVVG
ncbi:ran-binding protein 9 [Trichostrongylus colubriformis]|uniref:Ran-binding protein 9 n=1 Tax=Trichostrongylus colubriformis TaxID=6319 RepID=A0AAN8J1G0_TRICO